MAVTVGSAHGAMGEPVLIRRPGLPKASGWAARYARKLWLTDAIAIGLAVAIAYVVRFDVHGLPAVSGSFSPSYLAVSLTVLAAWLAMLAGGHSRDRRQVGSGPGEYSRVFTLTWRLFAGVAVTAYLLQMRIGRGYIGIAAPLGLALLLLERFAWRQWLHSRRMNGAYQSGVLVIGHLQTVRRLIEVFHSNPRAGYGVIGVCVPTGDAGLAEAVGGVPIVGAVEDTAEIARRMGADAVAVAGSDTITTEAVRRLGWDLEGAGIDPALAVALTDIAGPRVLVRPVNGLPLMYVDEPRINGFNYLVKSAIDWVGAFCITIFLSPALLVIAVAIKTTSSGPVFYTQDRVGRDGSHFRMFKFRSMELNAHDRLAEVLALEGVESIGMFYKPKNDPRVTPVGRVIRKYSLDELPQLLNVLRGDMSLVGPRPPIDNKVALYDRKAHRRLLVKPGNDRSVADFGAIRSVGRRGDPGGRILCRELEPVRRLVHHCAYPQSSACARRRVLTCS